MVHEQVVTVTAELRKATNELASSANPGRFDVSRMEKALAWRERAVRLLGALAESDPRAFTEADLEEIRISQSCGKRALEGLLEVRRAGWEKAAQIAKNQYVMSALSPLGCNVATLPHHPSR
jgi:hypothetical protein